MEKTWKVINSYFSDNEHALVSHHIESYNNFIKFGIKRIFKENNPIKILKNFDEKTNTFNLQCILHLGGKQGDKIYYGKPIIYDENNKHFMYPNEARLRNMTYGLTIHYDVEIEYLITINGQEQTINETIKQVYLGKFPIMLHSNYCLLNRLDRLACYNLGECKNDPGGYFIINGKEKVIVCQEKFADNMINIQHFDENIFSTKADIRCRSEDASKPVRTTSVCVVAPTSIQSNNQIVVMIPNVKKPMPLFIVMRALGVISDKDIIKTCLLDLKKNESYMEYFLPSIHDTHNINTQENALNYIKEFTKEKTTAKVLDILCNYFLSHIGDLHFKEKAYFLGYMVFEVLKTHLNHIKPTDRDNFKYKRIEVTGSLLYDLFKEYYKIMQNNIYKRIDKEFYFHKQQYQDENFSKLVQNNSTNYFIDKDVEVGFKKAFLGNWGSQANTKKQGVVQDLNRLSFNSFISHLRKIILPLDASAKIVKPRLLHPSQYGYICPLDTPDGGNVGLHKHLSITTQISTEISSVKIIELLKDNLIVLVTEELPEYLGNYTKIFVNGSWIGIVTDPIKLVDRFRDKKRLGLIPYSISISFNILENQITIFSDSGRVLRPIFYINDKESSFNKLVSSTFTWKQLIYGFNHLKKEINKESFYKYDDLYQNNDKTVLYNKKGVIDMIDVNEEETAFISFDHENENKHYTHVEIHPSLMLGIMGNQIIFPENNPLPRNLFSCGQSKQGVSLYSTNYQLRIDKMGVVLNYGQIPLLKSRYTKIINNEENPYGENVLVAIGVFSGYNVEDSILFNKASVDRGMFRTTYYTSYQSREESKTVPESNVNSYFKNIEKTKNILRLKPGYDYSHLDDNGIIKQDTTVNDKIVLIGKVIESEEDNIYVDDSVSTKKGQLGVIDKTFITDDEQGFRLAKIRIREERIPAIGDKFCSRCGQKGTIGNIIPEEDMPFNKDGLRPDIIINPHALPSRMTIGQLIETLTGKACCILGYHSDMTAFNNKGEKSDFYGKLLLEHNFSKTGCEVLYNGENGEQIEADFYLGPTYYMRLKHMVKDKINYRSRGPRTSLTRQTVQGRANDGGLRIGEMERDALLSHGIARFLNESMLVRGDLYHIAICNLSGSLAIYNENKNLFLSPMVDGPIRFINNVPPHDIGEIATVSKYGRDFSILKIPYSFKLLLQELLTMNISMKLITDDNIDQLTNLSYSDNLKQLVFSKETSEKIKIKKANKEFKPIKLDSEQLTGKVLDKEKQTESSNDQEKQPTFQKIKLSPTILTSNPPTPTSSDQPIPTQPAASSSDQPIPTQPAASSSEQPIPTQPAASSNIDNNNLDKNIEDDSTESKLSIVNDYKKEDDKDQDHKDKDENEDKKEDDDKNEFKKKSKKIDLI